MIRYRGICIAVILAIVTAAGLVMGAEEQPIRKAASYAPGGSTTVEFKGTPLLPKAGGSGSVTNKGGSVGIKATFKGMEPARNFGTEFLTYVMWAVTPDGNLNNVGELVLSGDKAELISSTQFQSFGLFVTAEPYFAVGVPSTKLVLENVFSEKVKFPVTQISRASLMFSPIDYKAAGLEPLPVDPTVPEELYQARNAVRIAKWQKADTYAPDVWARAQSALGEAEAALAGKENRKTVVLSARTAVQAAEDARAKAVIKGEEEKRLAEKKAADDLLAAERLAAEQRDAKAKAETAAVEMEKAKADAARTAAQAETQKAQASAQKAQADARKLRTDLMAQLNRVLETKDTGRGLVVNMAGVSFDTGKADLKPDAREKLAKLAGIMLAHPTLRLDIEGHTDNTGKDEVNQTLSQKRAEAVMEYLAGQGVPADSMTAKGMSSSAPVADNETDDGRQKNRRVELIISGKEIGQA